MGVSFKFTTILNVSYGGQLGGLDFGAQLELLNLESDGFEIADALDDLNFDLPPDDELTTTLCI